MFGATAAQRRHPSPEAGPGAPKADILRTVGQRLRRWHGSVTEANEARSRGAERSSCRVGAMCADIRAAGAASGL